MQILTATYPIYAFVVLLKGEVPGLCEPKTTTWYLELPGYTTLRLTGFGSATTQGEHYLRCNAAAAASPLQTNLANLVVTFTAYGRLGSL